MKNLINQKLLFLGLIKKKQQRRRRRREEEGGVRVRVGIDALLKMEDGVYEILYVNISKEK